MLADDQDHLNRTFGVALAQRRRGRAWSQTDLAKELAREIGREYSQTMISQWERGEAEVPSDVRAALVKLLGVFDAGTAAPTGQPSAWPPAPLGLASERGVVNEARRIENFRLWSACVGLDDAFPRLASFPGPEGPFLNVDRERRIDEILEFTASAAGPTVLVSFAAGHGVTTFARHVADLVLRGSRRSAVLPVSMWWGDVIDDTGVVRSREDVAVAMRRRLLLSLAMKQPGVQGTSGQLGLWAEIQPWASHLIAYVSASPHRTIDELPWDPEELEGRFAGMDLGALIRLLADDYNLFTSIYVDTSSSPKRPTSPSLRRGVAPLFHELADLQGSIRDETGFTFSIVAFVGGAHVRDVERALRESRAELQKLTIRPYAPSEVYRMLMDRYGADLGRKVNAGLLVGLVRPEIPLRRTETLLLERILGWFDGLDQVAYELGSGIASPFDQR